MSVSTNPSPFHAGALSPVDGRSFIDLVDPRARVLMAAAVSVAVAAVNGLATLAIALAVGLLAAVVSRLPPLDVVKRLLPVNILMLFLFALLPWSTSDSPSLFSLGPLHYTHTGLLLAGTIALKANAVVLSLIVLLGTLDFVTLGHALNHLHVPDKLTHILLFTVRYLDVLHREYLRLRAAMKMRAFRPRMSLHTCRAYGYLVGMLLDRSLDRSERIVAAMKCRGFRGRFFLLDHFAFSRRDAWFAAASLALLVTLALVEWL